MSPAEVGETIPAPAAAAAAPAGAAAGRLRVLVVDDDVVDRKAVRRALGRAGVHADAADAATGPEALDMVAAADYDCVFLDYNIPGSDGLNLLRRILELRPHAAVVMLTGQGDEQVAVELMKAGAVDYLPKGSLTPERLASSLRYAVELKRASALARLAEQELRDSALRARFLAEASAALTSSLDPRDTIGEVARLAVPFLADFCLVFGLDDAGAPTGVAAAHHDPALQPAVDQLTQQYQPDVAEHEGPVRDALRSGETVLVDRVTTELLRQVAGSDSLLGALHELRPAALLMIPLTARRTPRGLMVFARSTDRPGFAPQDVELATDLAQRTALAFEHARLFEEAERARSRTERLQRVTASLASVLPQRELGELFVEQVCEALGADTAWVALIDAAGSQLEALAYIGFDAADTGAAIGAWNRFAVDAPVPSRDVLRDGRARWFPSQETLLAQFPGLAADPAAAAQKALAVLPLDAGTGIFGVMTLGYRDEREFPADDRALAFALAGQFAQALERARLYEAERDARRRAETANRAKSEFLARMSHDLRTPLNAIGGYAELVEIGLQGPVTTQQVDAMQRVRRAKDHLLTLINDILSFAKLEAGQVTISIEAVDVRDVVREVHAFVEPQVEARGLRYSNAGGPQVMVRADRERLVQVLINLLTNAVKFTDSGEIGVGWDTEDDRIRIHVRDTGRGIAADRLPSIFDPFVQERQSAAEPSEGVGLGLAIGRELLRLMQGELTVVSEQGRGSTFTIHLPLA